MNIRCTGLAALGLFILLVDVQAQWVTQEIPLSPGWNPVYLGVQPAESDCDKLFTHPAIESVWMFNKRFTTVEFDQDPSRPFPEPTHWIVWMPPSHPQSFLRSLYNIQGAEAYLIKVSTSSPAFNLSIKGQPVIPRVRWIPQYYNFVGFPLNPVAPPTFAEFFRHAEEINGEPGDSAAICTIGLDGHERAVRQTSRMKMERGVAYWVKCSKPMDFTAPFHVRAGIGFGLNFNPDMIRQSLYVDNVSPSNAFTVRIRQQVSEDPPPGAPEKAGDVPLAYYARDPVSNTWEWADLPADGITETVAPGATWELRLAVRPDDLNLYTPSGTNGASYQSLLEVTDSGQSLRYYVPVAAEATAEISTPPSPRRRGASTNSSSQTGLWVGDATIDKVSRAALGTNITWDAATPTNTASDFSVRLIVHVDSAGLAMFLQNIMMSWVPPPTTNDTGYYALWTDESKMPQDAVGAYRISSVAFPPALQAVMAGSMSNELTCTVPLGYNDPSNPFKHLYHPDHDNLDARYQPLGPGIESWTVNRDITLDFGTNGVETGGASLWGKDAISGTYRETVEGLMREPVYIEGAFELKRIADIGILDQ